MSTPFQTKFFKLSALPAVLEPNAFYYILNGEYAETYITGNAGSAKMVGNSTMINNLIDAKLEDYNAVEIVANIAERNSKTIYNGQLVLVQDASGDTTVDSGSALYIYNGTTTLYTKLTEYESLDLALTWESLIGKPNSSVTLIDNAVNRIGAISSSAADIDNSVEKSKDLTNATDINTVVNKVKSIKSSPVEIDKSVVKSNALTNATDINTVVNKVKSLKSSPVEIDSSVRFTEGLSSTTIEIDSSVSKSHNHDNSAVLELVDKDSNGNMTFDGKVVNSWGEINW